MKSFKEIRENKQRNIKVQKGGKTRMLRKQELSTYLQMGWKEIKEEDSDPCWKGYEMIGMKKGKDGKEVPNCVPKESVQEEAIDEKMKASYKDTKSYSVSESLKKSIAQNSSKFPEGSKVRCNKSGKTGKVLTVGKDFVKVAVDGGKDVDYKPSELSPLKESLEEGSFAIHKNGKPMNIKGKPVTTTTKAAAEKAINTMMQKDFNKNAKFTVVAIDDKKKSAPAGAVKPRTTSDKEWKMAEIRRKHRSMPAWRRAERGE